MALTGFVVGYADFHTGLSAVDTARLLSASIFAGIPFCKDEDDEYEGHKLTLQQLFLGIAVSLIGSGENGFTIELSTVPSGSVANVDEVSDFSAILAQQLSGVPGITLLPPTY